MTTGPVTEPEDIELEEKQPRPLFLRFSSHPDPNVTVFDEEGGFGSTTDEEQRALDAALPKL